MFFWCEIYMHHASALLYEEKNCAYSQNCNVLENRCINIHRCINFTQTYPKKTTYPKSIFKKKTLSKLKFSSTSATTSLIITTQSHNQFSQILWFFDGVYFFLWPAFLSVYLLQADIWEESLLILRCLEDHTGNLPHCRQILQLIKFNLIKNTKGIGWN